MTHRIISASLLAIFISIQGCATLKHPFAPPPSFDTDADIQALETHFGTATVINDFYAGDNTVARRNNAIIGRLTVINLQYIKFIRQFAADKAQLDTAMDMLQLGVDLAITVVGGATVKAALGAASAGIGGTRLSINKNFYFEKTVPVLITAMNAQRKEALIPIIKGMSASITEYHFAQGITDLDAYYHAGTFIGALQSIQADAGVKEAKADNTIIVIKRKIALAKKEARDRVEVLLNKIEALSDDDAKALAKNPPIIRDEAIEAGLNARDPENERLWLTDPSAARQALKFMLSLSSFDDLTKWETVLK